MKEKYKHKGLLQILVGSIDAIIAARLNHDYSGYMAPNTLKIGPLDGMLWTSCSDESWQDVLRRVEAEIKKKFFWRSVRNSDYYPPDVDTWLNPAPCTPYTKILEKAASDANMTLDQMIFEIQDYLSRKQPSHRGIQKLIETCSWYELAHRLMQDKEIIDLTYGIRPQEARALKKAIGEIEDRWFEPGLQLGNISTITISTEAMEKTMELRRTRFEKFLSSVRIRR